MTKYRIEPSFIGKFHSDSYGQYVLNDKLSQRVLAQLFKRGNKFIIAEKDERKSKRKKK